MRAALLSVLLLVALLPRTATSTQAERYCAPTLRLDHVVIAVHDPEAAEATYRALGFSPKPGRLHSSGLRNLHLKMPYGGELELMSVGPPPRESEPSDGDGEDKIAAAYRRFLDPSRGSGEGGAYLALVSEDLDAVVACLRAAGFDPHRWTAGGHEYVTFPEHPELAHLFFLGGRGTLPLPEDAPAGYLDHANWAKTLDEVHLDGTPEVLGVLLEALGAPRSADGAGYNLACGRVVFTPPEAAGARPRVRGVVLGGTSPFEADSSEAGGTAEAPDETYRVSAAKAHGIWLELPRRPSFDTDPND